jgi:hypothetical protein
MGSNPVRRTNKLKNNWQKSKIYGSISTAFMVGVAQLVELQVVALVAAGSSPVAHPNLSIVETVRLAVSTAFLEGINCARSSAG